MEGGWVDRLVGLEGVRAQIAMLQTPDGHGRIELAKFHSPRGGGGEGHAPANTPGIRHVTFAVKDLDGVRADIAMLQTPDGHGRLELTKFHTPSIPEGNQHAPANAPGIRHVAFLVEDIDAVVAGLRTRGTELVGELERYEDSYRLCYVRGPEGIIVELAERIG